MTFKKNPVFCVLRGFFPGAARYLLSWIRVAHRIRIAGAVLIAGALTGCRTVAPLPPADLSQPGWTVKQGQAVWQMNSDAPEIAGEVLVAIHVDGRTMVQFTKTPFPLVIAQTTANSWHVESPARDRRYSGRGSPPSRVVWFQLARAIAKEPVHKNWRATATDGSWRIENRFTGETLEGYLTP